MNVAEHIDEMSRQAQSARKRAYAPYSNFTVGAAVLCDDGKLFTGCNIENVAYSPTICAERVAIFNAISEGNTKFAAIMICAGKRDEHLVLTPPCGVCLQVMAEFCTPNLQILLTDSDENIVHRTLKELLPFSFQ